MDHKIRYGGSNKAGWTWECSCGESEGVGDTPYAEAFDRTYWAKKHLDEVRAVMEHDDVWVEVDLGSWYTLPKGTRVRCEWSLGANSGGRRFVHRDDLPDTDTDAVAALREASWSIPRLDNGQRPDPLPGLPEARDLLIALHEAGFDVVRKEER